MKVVETLKEISITKSQKDNRKTPFHSDIMKLLHTAMWKAIGNQTKLSRTQFTVVFAEPWATEGPCLSTNTKIAINQVEAAGIPYESITEGDIRAYLDWRESKDWEKDIGKAKIMISRPFKDDSDINKEFVRVALKDGHENRLTSIKVACHHRGVDYEGVFSAIRSIASEFPEYKNASVIDNNQKNFP